MLLKRSGLPVGALSGCMLELCPAGPSFLELWFAMVWLGRASLKPCSGKVCFGKFQAALVHLEALSSDQLMKREGRLCRGSVRPALGSSFGWPWLHGVVFWRGPASLRPCFGKLCFGRFPGALVHLEALSSNQFLKRGEWLCWSSDLFPLTP